MQGHNVPIVGPHVGYYPPSPQPPAPVGGGFPPAQTGASPPAAGQPNQQQNLGPFPADQMAMMQMMMRFMQAGGMQTGQGAVPPIPAGSWQPPSQPTQRMPNQPAQQQPKQQRQANVPNYGVQVQQPVYSQAMPGQNVAGLQTMGLQPYPQQKQPPNAAATSMPLGTINVHNTGMTSSPPMSAGMSQAPQKPQEAPAKAATVPPPVVTRECAGDEVANATVELPSELEWNEHEKCIMKGLNGDEQQALVRLKGAIKSLRNELASLPA